MNARIWLSSISLLAFVSCTKNPSGPGDEPLPANPPQAVYVLNEGQFGDPFGARLTVYDVKADSAYQDVIEHANGGIHLGNTGDDMVFHNSKAYILMSGSEDLFVISLANNTILQSATYPGNAPHDLVIDSARNRIYVTRLYKSSLYVLDLNLLSVVDSIFVGSNPQGMLIVGDRLFVCNSGYGYERTVSVVNLPTNSIAATLQLSDGPTNATLAPDGTVWVVCTGNAFSAPATFGRIYVFNPGTLAKVDSVSFSENLWGAMRFDNTGYAYVIGTTSGRYDGGPVHRIQLATKSVTLNYIGGTYYCIAYDAVANEFYAGDAKQFTSLGEVKIFSDGSLRKSFSAKYGPAVIQFKY